MNSRPEISNQQSLADHVQRLGRKALIQGTRGLVVINGQPENWLADFSRHYSFYHLDASSSTDRADRINALLGSERLRATFQLGSTPDYGLLAALAGTLRAGGILIVGTSALPQNEKKHENVPTSPPTANSSIQSQSISFASRRLIRLADRCAKIFPNRALCADIVDENTASDGQTSTAIKHESSVTAPAVNNAAASDTRFHGQYANPIAKSEQNALFARACQQIAQHSSLCLVINGRRGRGKSTLLARVAEHLHQQGEDFAITAMHASALSTYRQYADWLSQRYISPESAEILPSATTLFVDEAASFSLQRLQSYAANYQRLIVCTTVEGYESSGRAFDIRLLPELARIKTNLTMLEPAEPWRWVSPDPLETFTDELLLTNLARSTTKAPLSSSTQTPVSLQEQCNIVGISQHALAHNEILLAQVQALLAATHYQSSAKDLEHLLDAPSLSLWVQEREQQVVAVLLMECEGNIDEELHEPILEKKRRLPHQLLPQLLAQTANEGHALSRNYARVLRIAVLPEFRRQGIGSLLLSSVTKQHDIDAIGASFAADATSIAFWNSQGFTEFHRGYSANPRTGKRAVAMLKALDETTGAVLSKAAIIHQANEVARQSHYTDHSSQPLGRQLCDEDIALLNRFANGQRSQHDTYDALVRLSRIIDLPLIKTEMQSRRSYELELRKCVELYLV